MGVFIRATALCPFIPINLPRSPSIMEKTPPFLTIECEIQHRPINSVSIYLDISTHTELAGLVLVLPFP
jgi:hypothetical protein